MRTQKVCLSIGVGLVILAIGFLALRSDVVDAPVAHQVEYQKYILQLNAYYTKRQELSDAWRAAQSEFDALIPEKDYDAFAEYVSRLTESDRSKLVSDMQRSNNKVEQAWKRLSEFRTTRPIAPVLPEFASE